MQQESKETKIRYPVTSNLDWDYYHTVKSTWLSLKKRYQYLEESGIRLPVDFLNWVKNCQISVPYPLEFGSQLSFFQSLLKPTGSVYGMYNVSSIRPPVSYLNLVYCPHRQISSRESLHDQFKKQLAQGPQNSIRNAVLQPPLTARRAESDRTQLEIQRLKDEVSMLKTALEKEKKDLIENKEFGSKLANKLICLLQFDEDNMKECINLGWNFEAPNPYWQVQRCLWGTKAWEKLDAMHLKKNGKCLPASMASNETIMLDAEGITAAFKAEIECMQSSLRRSDGRYDMDPDGNAETVFANIPSPKEDFSNNGHVATPVQRAIPVVERTPTFTSTPIQPIGRFQQANPVTRTQATIPALNYSGPTHRLHKSQLSPISPGVSQFKNTPPIRRTPIDSTVCLHKSNTFPISQPSQICCIPELVHQIEQKTSTEVKSGRAVPKSVEEQFLAVGQSCDFVIDCCRRIDKMENLNASVTQELKSALNTAREITEFAVQIVDTVQQSCDDDRQIQLARAIMAAAPTCELVI